MGLIINYSIKKIVEKVSMSERNVTPRVESENEMLADNLAKYITNKLGFEQTSEGYVKFKSRVILVEEGTYRQFALANVVEKDGGLLLRVIPEDKIDSEWVIYGVPVGLGVHNIFEYCYIQDNVQATCFIIDFGDENDFIMIASYWIDPTFENIIKFYRTAVTT